jgi:hypothetical protein
MQEDSRQPRRHLMVSGRVRSESYTAPNAGGGPKGALPSRIKSSHASKLMGALETIRRETEILRATRQAAGISTDFGIILEFEAEAGYPLKAESLDSPTTGLQLLNVRTQTHRNADGEEITREFATVRVPTGQLDVLEKKIREYRDEVTAKKKLPLHQPLIDPIADIRAATLQAFWNEDTAMPDPNRLISWEVWLHTGIKGDEREIVAARFITEAQRLGIEVSDQSINLPESTILLVRATATQLAESIDLLNCLAELRAPQITASFFTDLSGHDQSDWVRQAADRILQPPVNASAVCLLDSGVNDGHPLLKPAIAPNGLQTYNPAWTTADGEPGRGHGTPMAGVAAYVDLTALLASKDPIHVPVWVESVKAYERNGSTTADPQLWGSVIRECVARIEAAAPFRRRVFSLQITSPSTAVRGRPTSWSAEIDQLCSGAGEESRNPRLVVISAGNARLENASGYPDSNQTTQIHDPAQSWNALVVGACTSKVRIEGNHSAGLVALAPEGGLSPSSSTSLLWKDQWPLKPDIVMEGGNLATDSSLSLLDSHDSLSLLSTSADLLSRPLTATGETSAAAVQAARLAAIVQDAYPSLWPETVRAIMVHSSRWTPAMLEGIALNTQPKKGAMASIVRQFGFGTPNQYDALHSARNVLTLVTQDQIQPYLTEDDGNIATHELRFHTLPWPKEQLAQLGGTEVQMRVTLSYFIEPNPGPRVPNDRYRYASCGLRFDLRRPTESEEEFRIRINRELRPSVPVSNAASDSEKWILGSDWRHRGSIHSDLWIGPAVELAEKNHIAVIPVSGWWRERAKLGRANSRIRYALVVTIRTPPVGIDIYTPVESQIGIPISITSP